MNKSKKKEIMMLRNPLSLMLPVLMIAGQAVGQVMTKNWSLSAKNPSYRFHYPLNPGDFWQYEYQSLGTLLGIECREVTGDTLMPNGKTYLILKSDFALSSNKYQRIADSTKVYQLNKRYEAGQVIHDEFLIFSLDIKEGDTWNFYLSPSDSGFFKVTEIADTTLWSHTFRFARIEDFTLPDSTRPIAPNDYILVDSIGVLFHGFEGGFLRLQGAIISGRQFGVITSLQGLENSSTYRPIEPLGVYPNPFNSSTTIEYQLNTAARIRISIYDLLGRRVKLLLDSFQTPGLHKVKWNGDNELEISVASGIYFYSIEMNGTRRITRKITLMK